MVREKSEIEKSETPQEQADRLRYALFLIYSGKIYDINKAAEMAGKALSGQLHGYEPEKSKSFLEYDYT